MLLRIRGKKLMAPPSRKELTFQRFRAKAKLRLPPRLRLKLQSDLLKPC